MRCLLYSNALLKLDCIKSESLKFCFFFLWPITKSPAAEWMGHEFQTIVRTESTRKFLSLSRIEWFGVSNSLLDPMVKHMTTFSSSSDIHLPIVYSPVILWPAHNFHVNYWSAAWFIQPNESVLCITSPKLTHCIGGLACLIKGLRIFFILLFYFMPAKKKKNSQFFCFFLFC